MTPHLEMADHSKQELASCPQLPTAWGFWW
nr:MAG TPA: hypothetical protein [Caudoviricetes sp.]